MKLSDEQVQKIRENRAKALQILEQKRLEKEKADKFDKDNFENKNTSELVTGSSSDLRCLYVSEEEQHAVCTSSYIDIPIYETFGEQVCSLCKQSTDSFDLLSKSEAAKLYLIPDDAFRFLKFQEKDNPHNSSWTPMKLYLRKHLRDLALKRFGSFDKLDEERQKRAMAQYEKGLDRTRNALSTTTKELWDSAGEDNSANFDAIVAASASGAVHTSSSARSNCNNIGSTSGAKRGTRSGVVNEKIKKKRKALDGLISIIRGDD
mmetsp:Transcript_16939/g.28708  ORF Transcript_16939/g.28708 Transcript_16939/m.28708 type:complete len:263 (+) Transcript_16939:58-846(+)